VFSSSAGNATREGKGRWAFGNCREEKEETFASLRLAPLGRLGNVEKKVAAKPNEKNWKKTSKR